VVQLVLLGQLSGPGLPAVRGQERETLTFQDLMKVRQIRNPTLSADGRWVALAAAPDRGDGEVLVYEVEGSARFSIPLGRDPILSPGGTWVAARRDPPFHSREEADDSDPLRTGLVLLNTDSGESLSWEEVRHFALSGDGKWLARLGFPPEAEAKEGEEGPAREDAEVRRPGTREEPGSLLALRELASGLEVETPHVTSFSFHPRDPWIAYVVASPDGSGDGLYVRELRPGAEPRALEGGEFIRIQTLAWWEEGPRLAWVWAHEGEDEDAGSGSLGFWMESGPREIDLEDALPTGWGLPLRTRLEWSQDGERLFYGSRPVPREGRKEAVEEGEEEVSEQAFDPYDIEEILEDRAVDVWHTDDPLINPNQKQAWSRQRNRTYLGVYHVSDRRAVQLGDTLVQIQDVPENPLRAIGSSSRPYLKESTWTGGAEDLYLVDLATGDRTPVVRGFRGQTSAANSWIGIFPPSVSLSPGGRFLAWFQEDHWHLHDAEQGITRVLTEGMEIPFYDVDHDYPNPRGGHGVGGWTEGDEAVLLHDKFDLWRFPTDGRPPVNLTRGRGRDQGIVFRVLRVTPDTEAYTSNAMVYLASFDWSDKSFGFFGTRARDGGLETFLDQEKKFTFLAKAQEADRLLFSREDYHEFPDLWVSGPSFEEPRKVTDVNPGLTKRFAWGTPRLVEWTSDDGTPLHGAVVLPGNYEEGKRYPVLTYFYRYFSQRLHEFNEPVVNHRPSFPIYASDGYIVFLPDVRFEVGRPGLSAMKSVVPGVKKLVDLGLADPDALGLHGHSWSGYTTAFIVTQTNLFAAAVAGAPVANMTSAYGGIRWGSGLARQFQYEQTQSRLSGSLWEAPADYIRNSPLFFADRVQTPLVLMHGDEDDAVPWYQSIELYLALRRLGKQAVFLQYRKEPHHPQNYANKLDYSMRMKEFFDHFLKGGPAPDWWSTGVPYSGR
jgi:dipeptidyl aminopeptidase/acylaminoacyl peptidase